MSKKNNSRVFTENNMLLWICLLSSAVFFGLYAIVDIFVDNYPIWLGPVLFAADALFIAVVYITYKKKSDLDASFKESTLLMEKAMTGMMKNVEIPCILTLPSGLIAWCSQGAHKMLGTSESLLQKNFNELCSISIDDLVATLPESGAAQTNDTSVPVVIGERNYYAKIYRQMLGKNTYYLVTFTDYTEYEQLRIKSENEAPVVAHIVLDNLNEIAEYVRVNYRSAANEIEEILKKFATDMNGMIREYNRDRYIMVFSRKKYEECASNKFDILETVRSVRLGDSSVPVTISIGISLVGENFEE